MRADMTEEPVKKDASEEIVIWNKYDLFGKAAKDRMSIYLIWGITMTIIILGIGGLMVLSYYYNNRCYEDYKVISEVERSDSNNVEYQYFQKNILKFSNNGISLIDAMGKPIWNGGYDMKQVQVDTCADKVIAADIGGTVFAVYNGQDEGVSMETSYPIVRARVASQGVAAVLEQESDSNDLKLYDPYANSGRLLAEIPTVVTEEGYPMDFDISDDGVAIVASYMVTTGTDVKSQVNFYNFSEIGQDNRMLVGGKEYTDEMVAGVRFISDDEVAIFRENGVDVYTNMARPELKYSKEFDESVLSFAVNEEYLAVVTSDRKSSDKTIHIYDIDGSDILSQGIDYSYSDIRIYGDEVYFYSPHRVDIMRMNGTEKFACDFDVEIDGVFPSGNSIEYILVDHSNISKIRLMDK